MSLLTSNYLTMKQRVSQKVSAFVEKFKDVGGLRKTQISFEQSASFVSRS